MMDRSEPPTSASRRPSKIASAAIYITPPPQDDHHHSHQLSLMNVYRRSESPSGSRPQSPASYRSGSRTPTPSSSRPGSPVPHAASKHNHSIQDLLKLIGKKMSGRNKSKESSSPSSDTRRTSYFLEVPKDLSQFRSRSKSLDDGTARKQSPSIDSATAYKIYDEILKEGMLIYI